MEGILEGKNAVGRSPLDYLQQLKRDVNVLQPNKEESEKSGRFES